MELLRRRFGTRRVQANQVCFHLTINKFYFNVGSTDTDMKSVLLLSLIVVFFLLIWIGLPRIHLGSRTLTYERNQMVKFD